MSGILGEILRAGFSGVQARHVPIVRALTRCRTGQLGYGVHACQDCGHHEQVPRGCGNRHCPRCQGRLAKAWLERQQADLLDVPYFHVVFTVPHALLPLCAAAPRALYALLFDAAAQTLLQLGRERLGGSPGMTAILHTWGQRLNLHPHLHLIVTGGALDTQGRWHGVKSRRYLFPGGVISALFRGKFLAGLTALKDHSLVPPPPGGWPKLWKALGDSRWVTYCKAPFAGPQSVLAYLANYTHRVAISERRITHFDPAARTVTYRYRDYADGSTLKSETLSVDKFVRRFCQHLLPRSFTKIRHYGILANHARKQQIPAARAALARCPPRRRSKPKAVPAKDPAAPPACPHCGGTRSVCVALIHPDGRILILPAARRLALIPPRAPP
jgi:Putative transposase/Transposase zinc-binding domain